MKETRSLQLRENVALADYTTLGVGGPARYFTEVTSEDQLIDAIEIAGSRHLPVFVLGGGSNLLVSDAGFSGLVLHIGLRGVHPLEEEGDIISVAAGEAWDDFVRLCVSQKLGGIECLSGIPGTVGGTPVQNVGAYGQEVSESILSVRVLDRESQTIHELSNAECGFSYRTSIFNSSRRESYIVLRVTFALHPRARPRLVYPDLKRHFGERKEQPSLSEVRDAILKIRAGKAMVITPGDPDCRSAGSFFKNPVVTEETAAGVEDAARHVGTLADAETLPRYEAQGGQVKIPAAWLIERAGFQKGCSRGRVGLSSKHTLALVNLGGATAREVIEFMHEIQCGVKERFGIDLRPEPEFVGF
ncbi:MAG TPA: UDP-N-acetylmuramate dehydrogenase [Acidobacteriota bacterium]|nr:UDP-N-acetylmuramate dehydrogenase [Acidobacteriota bacterium]